MTEVTEPRAYAYRDMDPAYEDDAIARARQKLEAIRRGDGVGPPVGRLVGRVIAGVVFLGLPGLALIFAAVSMVTDPDPLWGGAAIVLIVALLLLYGYYRVYVGAKADTPRRALRLFYRSLGAGKTKRALRWVVPSDLDAFPRYQPDISGLGMPADTPFRFQERESFSSYWNRLLRYHTAPYCIASLKKVQVKALSPDVVVVRFRLTLMMNTRLWLLLVIVALIVALIIDLATRKTATADLEKILVRVDDEWHLFDGAWQGPEEETLGWIESA